MGLSRLSFNGMMVENTIEKSDIMKKYLIGMVAGAILATTASVYADEGLEKVEAYLRPSLPITLNGQTVKLENPPVMYDGSTYLKLRDVAALTGLKVNWNEETQTVELGESGGKAMSTDTTQTKTQEEIDAALKKAARIVEIPQEVKKIESQQAEIYDQIRPYEVISDQGLKTKDDFYYEKKKMFDDNKQKISDLYNELAQLTGQSQ